MKAWHIFLIAAVLMGVVFSPFASSSPDGLERVALDYGFAHREDSPMFVGLIPDYEMPGVENNILSTALGGLVGVAVTYIFVFSAACLLAVNKNNGSRDDIS